MFRIYFLFFIAVAIILLSFDEIIAFRMTFFLVSIIIIAVVSTFIYYKYKLSWNDLKKLIKEVIFKEIGKK